MKKKEMKDYILIWKGGEKLARVYRHIYGTLAEAVQLARGVELGYLANEQLPPRVQVWSDTPVGPQIFWPYQDAAKWAQEHEAKAEK